MKKKIFQLLFTLLFIGSGLLYFFQEPIIRNLMYGVVSANFKSTMLSELPDGLHVILCGAGSPIADPKRSGPCTAIIAGKQLFIIDAGSGASKNLTLFRIPQGEINGIFLTHFHSDHIDGLGELLLQRWVNKQNEYPVPVYGPEGVENVVKGFNLAYQHDHGYRVAHHGAEIINPESAGASAKTFTIPEVGKSEKLLENEGLTVSAFSVDHSPIHPAVGYRFDYKGRSIVISGDTKKSSNLQAFSQGVDVLVHEALNPELVSLITEAAKEQNRPRLEKITIDILDYHTTPIEAAEIARDAQVEHLLFTHIVPPLPLKPMESLFTKGVSKIYQGEFTVGKDGTMISLEANEKNIKVMNASSLF